MNLAASLVTTYTLMQEAIIHPDIVSTSWIAIVHIYTQALLP